MINTKLHNYKITYALKGTIATANNAIIDDIVQAFSPKDALVRSVKRNTDLGKIVNTYELIDVKSPDYALAKVELLNGKKNSVHYYIAREKGQGK